MPYRSHRKSQPIWPWLLLALSLGVAGLVAACPNTLTPGTITDEIARVDQALRPAAAPSQEPTVVVTEAVPTPTVMPVATVALLSPTATPSPQPTATFTPEDTPTPVPTVTLAPTTTPEVPVLVVEADVLNIRSGPSTAYPIIGRTSAGEVHTIVGKSEAGDWWQIKVGEGTGWVSGQWTRAAGPLEEVAVVQVAPPPTRQPQAQVAAAGAAPRPAGGGSFAYGIQIDPWGDRGAAIAAVKDLGITWVKFQLPWKEFEAAPGQRGFPDDVVNDLHNNGINILVSIVKAPKWARLPNSDFSVEGPPANPQDYANYVGAFAAHYCGRVQAVEVWNEQNLWYEWGNEPLDARRYVELLAAAYRAIKAACPGMIVVSGAPTPTGAPPPLAIRDTTYLEQMYQAGLKNYCDAIGVHPSGYGNPPEVRVEDFQAGNYSRPSHVNDSSFYFRNTMEQYRNIMVKYGDGNKRLWPTEFGWASTSSPVSGYEYAAYNSEQQQGEYIVRAFQMMQQWGFVGVAFLWNLNYNITAPGTEMAAFGIMGRPAYGMLRDAIRK